MTETELTLADLYEADETAWLEAMTELLRHGNISALDLPHLQKFLSDMALRERKEVESRLVVLLLHILKWEHQPDHRSRSWESTIKAQRYELLRHAGSGVLRKHAEAVLPDVDPEAVDLAATETGLSTETFPADCPYTFDELLAFDPA